MREPADRAYRLRRLRIRSWRRGTKEMDLILGGFHDTRVASLGADELADYEDLLNENDVDLYRWVSGGAGEPPALTPILTLIRAHVGRSGAAR